MKVRTFHVFTLGHWVYFAICGLALITMPLVIFSSRAEPHQRVVSVLVLVLMLAISAWLFKLRWDYKREIAWITRQGVSVLPGTKKDWLGVRRAKLDAQIDQAAGWWKTQHPDQAERIDNQLNGLQLAVVVQGDRLEDPRWGRQARAFAEPGKIRIWYPDSPEAVERYLKGYEGREVEDLFFSLVRHELAHVCLYAMRIRDDGDLHHERMKAEGCLDA